MHTMLPWRLRKVAACTPDLPSEAKAQYLLSSTNFSRQLLLALEESSLCTCVAAMWLLNRTGMIGDLLWYCIRHKHCINQNWPHVGPQ